MPKVGQPVQYYPSDGADPQAAQVIGVDDADCVCLVAYCPVQKKYVEHMKVPTENGPHNGGDNTAFWACLDEAPDGTADEGL